MMKKIVIVAALVLFFVGMLSMDIMAQSKAPPKNKSDQSCPATKVTCDQGHGANPNKIKIACNDAKREAREQCEGKNPSKSECQRYCEAGDCEVKSITCDSCSLVAIGYNADERQFVCTYQCCGECSCKGKKESAASAPETQTKTTWQYYTERIRNYFSR